MQENDRKESTIGETPAPEAAAPATPPAESAPAPADAVNDAAPAETPAGDDVLAAQIALDAKNEAKAEEDEKAAKALARPSYDTSGYIYNPPTFGPRDPDTARLSAKTIEARRLASQKPGFAAATPKHASYDTSGYKYSEPVVTMDLSGLPQYKGDEKAQTSAETAAATEPVAAPQKRGVSEEDNNACLARLAEILELQQIEHRAMLRNLELVKEGREKYTLPAGKTAELIHTTANTAVVAKGLFEFQDETALSAADALEAAVVVKNDAASYPHGVELRGNPRDRYMLMLAANHMGLKVTNPVDDAMLAPEERAQIEMQFAIQAVKAEKPAAPTLTQAQKDIVNNLLKSKDDDGLPKDFTPAAAGTPPAQAPAQPKPENAKAPASAKPTLTV
ncbi:MAG: hypothetical protein HYU57_01890 [Micavibrio aeruginosavorus]|nr:hypothetical protein [Micavibrio aeruginosavorus]